MDLELDQRGRASIDFLVSFAQAGGRVQALLAADIAKAGKTPVPGDMLTTSASGLDPDISPQTALRQVARVAKARGLPETEIASLVQAHTVPADLGFIGAPRVNVLELNLALDARTGVTKVASDQRHKS